MCHYVHGKITDFVIIIIIVIVIFIVVVVFNAVVKTLPSSRLFFFLQICSECN